MAQWQDDHYAVLMRDTIECIAKHHAAAEEASSASTDKPIEIDVVVSGGGFKGYFAAGALSLIQALNDTTNISSNTNNDNQQPITDDQQVETTDTANYESQHQDTASPSSQQQTQQAQTQTQTQAQAQTQTQRKAKYVVRRFAGASAGAWCAVLYTCNINITDWRNTYLLTRLYMHGTDDEHRTHSKHNLSKRTSSSNNNIATDMDCDAVDAIDPAFDPISKAYNSLSINDAYRRFATELLPSNAHELCSGKVFISITRVGMRGLENHIVSHFESRQDLIDACLASANIPYFSATGWGSRFRGDRVLDGGLTNNCPVFCDGVRPQIVFRLSSVVYPFSLSLSVHDPCIEALIIRGAMEMSMFLKQHHCSIMARATEPVCINTDLETFMATHVWHAPSTLHPQPYHRLHHANGTDADADVDVDADHRYHHLHHHHLHHHHDDVDDFHVEFPPIQLVPAFRLHPDQWERLRKEEAKKKRWSSFRSVAAFMALLSLAMIRIVRLDMFYIYRRFRWVRMIAVASLLTRLVSGVVAARHRLLWF
jgi:predicted acylesterase/phospholipase RssA